MNAFYYWAGFIQNFILLLGAAVVILLTLKSRISLKAISNRLNAMIKIVKK